MLWPNDVLKCVEVASTATNYHWRPPCVLVTAAGEVFPGTATACSMTRPRQNFKTKSRAASKFRCGSIIIVCEKNRVMSFPRISFGKLINWGLTYCDHVIAMTSLCGNELKSWQWRNKPGRENGGGCPQNFHQLSLDHPSHRTPNGKRKRGKSRNTWPRYMGTERVAPGRNRKRLLQIGNSRGPSWVINALCDRIPKPDRAMSQSNDNWWAPVTKLSHIWSPETATDIDF